MTVLAFAVVDADGPDLDVDFYGLPARLVTVGDVASVVVDAHEPPAVLDETLIAHHELVEQVAAHRACLPHRFGVVVDDDRLRADLEHNADVVRRGLDAVRGREEWLIRAVARPDRAADVALERSDTRPSGATAIDVGRQVHDLVEKLLLDDSERLIEALAGDGSTSWFELHSDRLGVDVVVISDHHDADSLASTIGEVGVGGHFDIETFGPTPCYRAAARVMSALDA